jgi:uncharacterized Zn finger protein
MSHVLALSPGGHLFVEPDKQAEPKLDAAAAMRLTEAFSASGAHGLEILASEFLHEPLSPTFGFWRGLARRYFTALCHNPNLDSGADLSVTKPGENDWLALAETAPPMKGPEYLSGAVLARLWNELDAHAHAAIVRNPGGAMAYLKSCNPTWNTVGRVTFHLAENKRNPAQPFAFLATYIELLQGKLSSSVMQIVTRPERGLFPTPKEIELDCSCPDWADLCKHVAASLYGVGAQLDQSPELLFLLRGVDPADLISQASAAETVRQSARAEDAAAMSEAEISDVFGIELADTPAPVQSTGKSHGSVDAKKQTAIPAPIQESKTKPPKKASRRISSSARAKIAAAARARWEKVKAAGHRDKPSLRKLSAAARAKIIAAQKARWARHETT